MVSRRVTCQTGQRKIAAVSPPYSHGSMVMIPSYERKYLPVGRDEGMCGMSSAYPVTGLYSIIYGNPFLLFTQAEG
jgi:hypothetical protein